MVSGFKKLKESLSKTRDSILGKIGGLIGSRKIDDNLLDEIEEILLKADIGVSATEKAIENLRLQATIAHNVDYLLIDTAGRLHTKTNLMKELQKIRRVTEKVIPPEQIFAKLIIDGTTGQNALSQVKVFADAVGCDGLIVTKLDGTARGGIMVAIAEDLSVSVDFIGIGEKIEDLRPFNPEEYVEALFEN
jgi:fused signal recognition particle receptor